MAAAAHAPLPSWSCWPGLVLTGRQTRPTATPGLRRPAGQARGKGRRWRARMGVRAQQATDVPGWGRGPQGLCAHSQGHSRGGSSRGQRRRRASASLCRPGGTRRSVPARLPPVAAHQSSSRARGGIAWKAPCAVAWTFVMSGTESAANARTSALLSHERTHTCHCAHTTGSPQAHAHAHTDKVCAKIHPHTQAARAQKYRTGMRTSRHTHRQLSEGACGAAVQRGQQALMHLRLQAGRGKSGRHACHRGSTKQWQGPQESGRGCRSVQAEARGCGEILLVCCRHCTISRQLGQRAG